MITLINTIVRDTAVRLKENIGGVYKYSSTQVQAPHEVAEKVLEFCLGIDDDKIYTDPNDPSLGRELEPHITIKYGLETKVPDEIEEAIKGESKALQITLKKISLFESEDKPYDVLKIDVESPDLSRLHDAFSKLPNQDTHPDYKPHLTIAYVKKGAGAEYLGNANFDGTSFEADHFYFKSSDGFFKKIELAVVPFDKEEMQKAEERFLKEPDPQDQGEDAEGIIKGTNAVSNMGPWQ